MLCPLQRGCKWGVRYERWDIKAFQRLASALYGDWLAHKERNRPYLYILRNPPTLCSKSLISLYVFIAFDIFSVNIIEDSNRTLHKEWTLQSESSQSACLSQAQLHFEPPWMFLFVTTTEASACTRTCLLQMCREGKMISKISMLSVFYGHWNSDCTFSDNYVFPISLLAWIFPAFTSVEVLHTCCSQISRPPMNALQMSLYVQTSQCLRIQKISVIMLHKI